MFCHRDMDMWEKSQSHTQVTPPKSRKTPSFSSTLLDSIYRSIDDSYGDRDPVLCADRGTRQKKPASDSFETLEEEIRRAVVVEKWMHKHRNCSFSLSNSASSSSESSCGGGAFSSSEAESNVAGKSRSSGYTLHRPRPIRTGVSARMERSEKPIHFEQRSSAPQQKPKREGRFTRTKSRALKMYGDLKKARHPISPGGRIASFLNSLFSSGNAKKAKQCSIDSAADLGFDRKSKSAQASTCSSVSSFSRSCLSKTPSSRGKKLSDGMKRCVRFYPVSVIVDEDSQPCGHKTLYEGDPSLTPTPMSTMRKVAETASLNRDFKNRALDRTRQVEAAARDLLRGYQTRTMNEFGLRGLRNYGEDEDDDDDDAESYSSSDLFELDNLIGIGGYQEELPVYETTNVETNQAIANGLIL